MSVKVFCDNCGSEEAARVTVDIGAQRPLAVSWPNRDADLCATCFQKLIQAVTLIWPKADKKPR